MHEAVQKKMVFLYTWAVLLGHGALDFAIVVSVFLFFFLNSYVSKVKESRYN